MTMKPLIALAALTAVVSSVSAQQSSSEVGVGISVGVYKPTSANIRQDLGDQFMSFGLGGATSKRPEQGAITPEYHFISARGNGNKLFMLPLTYGYEMHFGADNNSKTLPYLRPFVGIAYFDYSITDFATGQHASAKQFGGTAGAEAGVILSKKLKITAAYNYFTKANGLSFDGITLSATYSLLKL